MKRSLQVVSLLAAAACGGPGNVKGTVQGHTLQVAEAVFTANGQVVMSDQPGLCNRMKDAASRPNETVLTFALTRFVSMQRQPLDAEDYQVVRSVTPAMGDGHFGTALFAKLDGSCANTVAFTKGSATGSVGLVAVEAQKSARGSFDLLVGDGDDRITGTFDAPFCELPMPLPDATCE